MTDRYPGQFAVTDLDVKFKLKDGILSPLLQWVNRQDLRVIIRFDKLRTTYAQLTLPRFYAVVLHSSG